MQHVRRVAETLGVRRGPAATVLAMCWGTLAILVVAHVGFRQYRVPGDVDFALGRERGYGEVFFMIMTIWCVALCLALMWRLRAPVMGGWALGFGMLFVDDWFQLHERFGAVLGPSLGVRNALGEIVWLGALALVVGVALVVLHLVAPAGTRSISAVLFGLAAALAVAGVGMDYLHSLTSGHGRWLNTVMIILEDGGEILVMCLVTCYLFAVQALGHRPRVSGWFGRVTGVPAEHRALR
ncbi:hypothetical protein [Isoptericola halotolerans]|uniref:Uncharacterized protein n=1 Tax=Isoptericola halotolerans TaxID=300560 RepID=A0ABX1ZZ12_9MICO|nr:hypothetical protein [Isoptericola halotolerans]NOV95847.1 hypothetical protein [Isoptericola halotolerans]